MRRVPLLGLFFFLLSGGAFAEHPLSLERAIEFALTDNLQLGVDRLQVLFPELQREIERRELRWRLQPGIRIESRRDEPAEGRARLEADKQFGIGARFTASAEWVQREEGESGELLEMRLEQPLFQRFGTLVTLANLDRADYRRVAARRGLRRETETLILRVVEVFTATLYNRERLAQDTAAVKRAENLVRLVTIRKRQGRATGVDVLEMDLLLRQAQLRSRRTREAHLRSRTQLAELLGRVPEQLPPLETVELTGETPPGLAESEGLAREHRLDREQALADYEEARRQLRLQEREFYPDVRLLATFQPESSLREEGWFAGVSAGQDLDPAVKRLQYRQEEAAVRAALTRIAAVELRISREVRDAHSEWRIADQELELARSQVELSEERVRLARGLYPSGRVGAERLRDAEEEWVRSQTELKEALLERVRVRFRFWHALGMILDSGPGA